MEYTKDTMPDGTVYERFEGTPEAILEVLKGINEEGKGFEVEDWALERENNKDE